MTTKEQTCEERIENHLANLEESVTDILKGYKGEKEGQDSEQGFEEWSNFPLSVETRKETKILLSWGGPSDFLSVVHDGADIFTVTYHFQDWFDGASRNIEGDSKIWEYAQTVIEAREEWGY